MQRVALINGKNINQDYDFSKILESVLLPGVGNGLEVQNGKVTPGFAFIPVTRTGKTFNVLFESDADVTIDTTGTKKVYIEINQSNIDDGSGNNTDGTGIGEIKTGASYPSSNYIKLASIDSGTITDEREYGDRLLANVTKDVSITGNWSFATSPQYDDVTHLVDGFDLNTELKSGIYRVFNPVNGPDTGLCNVFVNGTGNDKSYIFCTLGYVNYPNQWWTRTKVGAGFSNWEKLIVGGVPKLANTPDNRNIAQKGPGSYSRSFTQEFVPQAGATYNLGIPGATSTWWALVTIAPWGDANGGGQFWQYAYGKSQGEVYRRQSANNSSWGAWKREGQPDFISSTTTSKNTNGTVNVTIPNQTKVIVIRQEGDNNIKDRDTPATLTAEIGTQRTNYANYTWSGSTLTIDHQIGFYAVYQIYFYRNL